MAIGLGSFFLTASPTLAADQKIGTVDLQKVFEKYYKTVRSTKALKEEAADMQKERTDMVDSAKKVEADWQKLMDKVNDQSISAEERAKAKKEAEDKYTEVKSAEASLEKYDRACSARLQEKEHQRRDDIVKEIRNVLNADAKAAGYTLVLDVSGDSANMAPIVLYSTGVNDLTDSLIKELNLGAPPPDEADTKDSKAIKSDK